MSVRESGATAFQLSAVGLVLMLMSWGVFADSRVARTGPYKYTSTRCDDVYGPFADEATAAREAAVGEYFRGCEYPVYRVDQPWGALTSICTWVTEASHRDGIEYWSPRRYVADYTYKYFDWPTQSWVCSGHARDSFTVMRERTVCAKGEIYYGESIGCVKLSERDKTIPLRCDRRLLVGNPIEPATGTKEQAFDLGIGFDGLPLIVRYSTRGRPLGGSPEEMLIPPPETGQTSMLGWLWSSSLHRELVRQFDQIVIGERTGFYSRFDVLSDWNFKPAERGTNGLVALQTGYGFLDRNSQIFEVFDFSSLQPVLIQAITGKHYSLEYSRWGTAGAPGPGYLMRIVDAFGRDLKFQYERLGPDEPADAGLLRRAENSSGAAVEFSYDGRSRLVSMQYPDGWLQKFSYEDDRHPWALTGIADIENVVRRRFGYDPLGNAVLTSGPEGIQSHGVRFGNPPGRQTTETLDTVNKILYRVHEWRHPTDLRIDLPDGSESLVTTQMIDGYIYPDTQSQPAGSGCAAAVRLQAFDSRGSRIWLQDFNGAKTCVAEDGVRGLELVRVDGLEREGSCGVTAAQAALPLGSRKITKQWHPDWSLETRVAEPGRITTKIYNGQPDPLNGNAIAACAPSLAKLPDSKPIVVLCKEVTQATTDGNGAQGFAASIDASVPARIQQWTYNRYGQVLTHDGPRTDVVDRTTYTYYDTTTDEYTRGDLEQIRNALGHLTRFPRYNRAGRPLQRVDSNGVVSDYRYDLRQRLTSVSVDGASTSFEYHPAGLLKRVTEADGSHVEYGYDAAQRLTSVSDSRGNSLHYELDNAGNRKGEQIRDPAGTLRRKIERVFDALNRLEHRMGRELAP